MLKMRNNILSEILSFEGSKAHTSGVGLDHANNLTNLSDVKSKSSYHATDAIASKYQIPSTIRVMRDVCLLLNCTNPVELLVT
jgi:hypothetical protein